MFCHLYNIGLLEGKNVWINDYSKELIDLYVNVAGDCEGLIYVLKLIEGNYLKQKDRKKWYYEVRDAYAFDGLGDGILNTATFYFLLKTSFNGIVQHIEGSDKYASPAGLLNHTDSVFDYDLIRAWSKALQGAEISRMDGAELIGSAEPGAFVFVDPPYRDSFKHYGVDDFDHDLVLSQCTSIADRCIVWYCNRYTDDGWYEKRKRYLSIETFDVTYTAGRRKKNEDGTHSAVKAKEVLLHNGESYGLV